MTRQLFRDLRMFRRRLVSAILMGATIFMALPVFHDPKTHHDLSRLKNDAQSPATAMKNERATTTEGASELEGAAAREYLTKTDEGLSLARAFTAARFGLKWQDRSPFGKPTSLGSSTNLSLSNKGGYLGMSHVQNLNAWFDDQGVTIRPTLPEAERDKSWQLGMKLKAYGYGAQLQAAPPIVSRNVKDNRIEYERDDFGVAILDFGLKSNFDTGRKVATSLINQKSQIKDPKLIEWYENKAAGIEQGFTLDAPPARASTGKSELLRLVVQLDGDLRARTKSDGSAVELLSQSGDAVLSYGQLVARDARGRELSARMETNAEGSEIALAVDDRDAAYPIEIDPVTASLEQKLTAPTPQAGGEFGDAVAISRNVAVLGAFREDRGATVDEGRVYIFTRSGSTWTLKYSSSAEGGTASEQCGWSVAINRDGDRVAYGCPGFNSNTGFVELLETSNNWSNVGGVAVNPAKAPVLKAGDRYGESVGLSDDWVFAGAPFGEDLSDNTIPNVGNLYVFLVNLNLTIDERGSLSGKFINSAAGRPTPADCHFGASLAVAPDRRDPRLNTLIVGIPGVSPQIGALQIFHAEAEARSIYFSTADFLKPSDGGAGDVFAYSVAISGDTAVVGAPLNDNAKGTDAGAAYVFVRDRNGNWAQQQKLIAGDGIDQDQFGESVAIEGNTVIVGSPYNGSRTFVGTRGNGRTYVFTRNINTWTEQTIVSALFDGAPVDKFGIAVAFSGDTIISGAEHATVGNFSDAGAAYIHRLSCVPPGFFQTIDVFSNSSGSICPGDSMFLLDNRDGGYLAYGTEPFSYQWRKNGVNIPGATGQPFEIKNASASDAGSYDFIVSNSCGAEISTPFILTVYNLSVFPSTMNIGYSGTSGFLAVQYSGGSCPWTAQSNASWITITSGSSGTSNGNVGFTVAANTGPQRTGTMTVAGQTVTVNQDAAPNLPYFLLEQGTANRAVALDSVTFVRGPFRILNDHNFSSDHHTRVILFTSNLGLTQPDASILTVQAGGFNLPVENVGPLLGVAGLDGSYIVVRLPDGLPSGDLTLTLTLRGLMGNPTILSISP